ncbi:MAG: carboxypeptidase-like regulatory domain-containing protein [Saprospiraceae bacterium]
MLKRFYLLATLFLFLGINLNAQEREVLILKGRITTASSEAPLPATNIFNITSQQGTTSDRIGEFELRIIELPALLQFTHVGYETLAIWINDSTSNWLDVKLHPYFETLPDVIVSAKPIVEPLTKPTYTVRDYIFHEDKVLLATLPGMRKGTSLVLIDDEGMALNSISIKKIKKFDGLVESCVGTKHLLTDIENYLIKLEGNRLELEVYGTRKQYGKEIEPCVGKIDSLIIYRFRYCIGQLLRFQGYEVGSEKRFLMAEVANDDNLKRRYREELAASIGYIDHMDMSWEEKQLELKRALENNMDIAGLVNLFYKPINIPLLQIGQQFLIFNYLKSQIQVYDEHGEEAGAIPITYQKEKKWDGDVIMDKMLNEAYTIFNHPKGKVVRKINLEDGSLGRPILIECAMVEQIKVNNGNLFFLESGTGVGAFNRVLKKVKLD